MSSEEIRSNGLSILSELTHRKCFIVESVLDGFSAGITNR